MKRIYFIIYTLLFCSVAAGAQQTLTLNQCREKALEHNKSLRSAHLKVEKMDAEVKSYRANFMPRIDVLGGDFYNWGKTTLTFPTSQMAAGVMTELAPTLMQMGMTPQQLGALSQFKMQDMSMDFKMKNVFFAGAMLTQPLYMGGKINAAYKMAKLGQQMANANIRLTESEVIVETDMAYMQAVKAKQLVGVAKSYKALLDELQSNVDGAVRHGLRMRNDALKVQVKRNEVELNVQKAENAYRLACMNLCQVIGMDLNSEIAVDEAAAGMTAPQLQDARQLASIGISQRPEYEILQRKTDMASKNVRIAQSDYLPQVALMGGYSYLNGMELDGKRLFDHGSLTVGISVKIPVLEYFTQGRQKIRSARAEQQMAQLEQEELNEKMTLELTQCANNVSESALEVEITRKSAEVAAENLKMSKQQYEVGVEPLSDYLEAQAIWQKALADEIEARYQYFLAYSKYRKATGMLR